MQVISLNFKLCFDAVSPHQTLCPLGPRLRMHGILSGACPTILRPVRPKNGGVLDFGVNQHWARCCFVLSLFQRCQTTYCRPDLWEFALPQACDGGICLSAPKFHVLHGSFFQVHWERTVRKQLCLDMFAAVVLQGEPIGHGNKFWHFQC